MKRFRFRFDSILGLRKTRAEVALRALSSAQRAYQAELRRKQELLSELDEALGRREGLADLSREAGARVSALDYCLEQSHILGLKHRIAQADQAIVRASRAVQKALRTYLLARRQVKMMEVLYEKDFAEYKKAQAKRAQAEIDDLTVMRAHLGRPWTI